jgi:hypothetical protein
MFRRNLYKLMRHNDRAARTRINQYRLLQYRTGRINLTIRHSPTTSDRRLKRHLMENRQILDRARVLSIRQLAERITHPRTRRMLKPPEAIVPRLRLWQAPVPVY